MKALIIVSLLFVFGCGDVGSSNVNATQDQRLNDPNQELERAVICSRGIVELRIGNDIVGFEEPSCAECPDQAQCISL
jgi:hypothetical protein